MLARSILIAILALPFSISAQNFGGNPAGIKWKQVNLEDVRVIFPTGLDSQANRVANVVSFFKKTSPTIGGRNKKWNIILQTHTTVANAYVRMAPIMSEFYMIPPQDNFSGGSIRWDDNLVTHEDRHIQQLSNFNKGIAKVGSIILGQEGQLLADGIFIPNYFFEGDAVYQETLVSKQGRGRMPSFFNGFKSLWIENKNYKWIKIRSGSYIDYVPDHYPLGYMMMAYGHAKFGNDFWNKITNDALNLRGFNKGIKRYSGKHFQSFYKDAMNFFKEPYLAVEGTPTNIHFITPVHKNNVIDYISPAFIGNDSIIVSKQSYRQPPSFYLIVNGKEKKIRVKDVAADEYFSYRNGKIVYAAFRSDARRANRDYSVINVLDIASNKQQQISCRTRYFSPDINETGNEIIAVSVNPDGNNNLTRIDAASEKVLSTVPNPKNYFFTQTRYFDNSHAVSAVREPGGKMALVKIDLGNGNTETLTPFTFNVMGFPFVKGDTIYFSFMDKNADKVFAVTLPGRKIFRLTSNVNGIYQPVVNNNNEMMVSAFTASGYRLGKISRRDIQWNEISAAAFSETKTLVAADALDHDNNSNILSELPGVKNKVTPYRKALHLFSFHSWRPLVDDPEYGYSIYSDDVLTSFSNVISYRYNRSDKSHGPKITSIYSGWFPQLALSAEYNMNRTADTAIGKSIRFSTVKFQAQASVPFSFTGKRSSQFLSFGAGYNIEPFYYNGIGKNVFTNKAINYVNGFLSFTNQSRRAKQNIFPHWAQSISVNYRDAFNYRNSHKFVGNSTFYFPGIFTNHSFYVNASYQQRDTLPDLFSKTFSYSRGYEALSTRQMYRFGVNYQLPIAYPEWGILNVVFIQRMRLNGYYDFTAARARLNGVLTDIKNRSTGAELYIDTKVWNQLPISIGVRYARLLDRDLLNPGTVNRWEIILPIGIIPD